MESIEDLEYSKGKEKYALKKIISGGMDSPKKPGRPPMARNKPKAFKQAMLPEEGFVRLAQIIGNEKAGLLPILPINKKLWERGVR